MLYHTGEKIQLSNEIGESSPNDNGERKHQCTMCRKAFTARGTWTIHVYIHTGVKQHQCSDCNKSFTYVKYLKKHVFIISSMFWSKEMSTHSLAVLLFSLSGVRVMISCTNYSTNNEFLLNFTHVISFLH